MADHPPQSVLITAKTVDDAVQRALRQLGLNRSQVEVTVLTEGRPGIFGIGATEAEVRVSAIGAVAEPPPTSAVSGEDAPLPRIDDYADYAEVQRRPPDHGGRGRSVRGGRGRDRERDGGRDRAPRVRDEDRPSRARDEDRAPRARDEDRAPRARDEDRSSRVRDEDRSSRVRDEDRGGRGRDRRDRRDRRDTPPRPAIASFELLADPDYEPEEDDPTRFAVAVLTDLLHLVGVEASVAAREPETPIDGLNHARAVLDVTSPREDDDLSLLIGRQGESLAALQYVLNLIVNRAIEGRHAFTVDVAGHKRAREETINALARELADEVKETGETTSLDPMPAAERRIVHLALAEDADVETESAGEGHARRVQIVYRGD